MATQYITCAFVDDYAVGDELLDWPLHITLVPWFFVDNMRQFQDDLVQHVADIHRIPVTVGEQRTWGPNVVNVIQRSAPLHELHARLLHLITSSGELLINQQYTGLNYTPHITHQKSLSAQPGDNVTIGTVYIIKKDTARRAKTVIARVDLV